MPVTVMTPTTMADMTIITTTTPTAMAAMVTATTTGRRGSGPGRVRCCSISAAITAH
jgi:hypothetical protein